MLWRCEYQIGGLERLIVAETEGIDSMEALTSAFDAIADDLDNSSYTVAYAEENGERDSRFDNKGNHGFERHGGPEMNSLLTHMFTAEVLRNNILYRAIANDSNVAELEATMLHHVAEAHRVGLQIDRRLCRGEAILLE